MAGMSAIADTTGMRKGDGRSVASPQSRSQPLYLVYLGPSGGGTGGNGTGPIPRPDPWLTAEPADGSIPKYCATPALCFIMELHLLRPTFRQGGAFHALTPKMFRIQNKA